jgi:hypothetical protein
VLFGTIALTTFLVTAGVIAQQTPPPACDKGLIELPANINGKVTLCSSLAAQVPALARQLDEITKAFNDQKAQISEMNRLIRGVNAVSQNIGTDRQTQLVRNLFSQLQISQRVGAEQTERQMAALADGFDQLRDQLIGTLTNQTTAARASAAVQGPLGDAIAQLDLSGAEKLLADIRAQLTTIGNQVAEVNQRTTAIQKTLEESRMDLARVSGVLAAADAAPLRSLTAAGLRPNVLEEAFRQRVDNTKTTVAAKFFENSASSADSLSWFDSALAAGADPNITLPGDYYDREGLLIAAMRAGNVPAMKILLQRGATPHAYQDLFLTSYPAARFLFPLGFIADDARLSLQQKQELAKAFMDAGVVIPRVIPPSDRSSWPSLMYQVNQLQETVASKLGVKLPPSTACCTPTPICKRASASTGEDWCRIVAQMPRKLKRVPGTSTPVYDIQLEYLLAIDRNKAYFLGLTYGISWDYVVVEVTKDASSWTVLRFMPPEAGMGLCKTEENVRPDYGWRRIPLQRVAGTDQMRWDDWGATWTFVPPNTVIAPP